LCFTAANGSAAGRRLHKERDWGDSGDPSGLGGLVAARAFNANRARTASRTASTPEAAETSANAVFTGIYRPFGSTERRAYAQAEGRYDNEDRGTDTIRPRTRSAIDVVDLGRRTPNLGSGEEQMAVLSVGGVALAETHEGAEAASASDALALNKGNRRNRPGQTTTAASMLNSRPPVFRAVDNTRTRSFGVSSNEGVGSLAMSGMANGKIVLAQAESAVAMSQTQTSTADTWQNLWREPAARGRHLRWWLPAFMQPQDTQQSEQQLAQRRQGH
jgi:hypothetical protein